MTVTQDQINEWKEKFGGVWELPIEDKTGYLKDPNMNDFKRAVTAMQKETEIAFGEEMLSALWIGGDTEIKTNDDYFLPAKKTLLDFFKYPDAVTNDLENRQTEILIGDERCVVRVITREDLRMCEKKNPQSKPFLSQEYLFDMVVTEKTEGFNNKNNPEIRFPLYQELEKLQNKKIGQLKKL
ncbi:hypothetical protein [Chryseobacterium ginsengisoli]